MVDLPSLPNSVPEVRAPTSKVSPGQIAAPFAEMADSMQKASDVVEKDIAEPLADRAGVAAVTLDDQGQPVVQKNFFPIVGDAAKHFENAARVTALAKAEPGIEEAATNMRLQHPGDPAGVKAAGKAYVDALTEKQSDPLIRASLETAANRSVGQAVRTSLIEANAINVKDFVSASQAQIGTLNDRAAALARQPGGVETPEYAQAVADRSALYSRLVADPRTKIPQERADAEMAEAHDNEKMQAVVGHAVEIYKTKSNAAEAQKFLQDAVWGPGSESLRLSPAKRDAVITEGLKALERVSGEGRAEVTAFREGLTTYQNNILKSPSMFDEVNHNNLVAQARALGDPKSILQLDAIRTSAPILKAIRGLPADQQNLVMGQLARGVVPAAPTRLADRNIEATVEAEARRQGIDPALAKAVVQVESGGNPNAARGSYKGLFQLSDDEFNRYGGGRGGGPVTDANMRAADAALHLTPQERALYQRHLTNLTGPGGVDNPDGSRSTLYQTSFERDGKTYNIPTVWDGKIVPPQEAIKRAEREGLDKFPSYGSEDEAEARYEKMHEFMERDTGQWLSGNRSILEPQANARAGIASLKDKAAAFERANGRPPSATELYLAHQQGQGGLAAHMAQPDAPAWQNMAGTAEGRVKGESWAKQAVWNNIPDDMKRMFPGGVDSVTSRQFMNVWASKIQGVPYDSPLQPGRAISSATSNPYVEKLFQSVTTQMREEQGKNAEQLSDHIIKRVHDDRNPVPPDTLQTFVTAARGSGREDLLPKVQQALEEYDKLQPIQQGGASQAAALHSQIQASRASGGADPTTYAMLGHIDKMVKDGAEAMKADPLSEGGHRQWITPINPLDASNPQTFAAELAQRDKKIGIMRQQDPGLGPLKAFGDGEGQALKTALTQGDPAAAKGLLDALPATLSPDNYRATMVSPPMKEALDGMIRSYEPTRLNAAMATLDKLQRTDPQGFKKDFGGEKERLDVWRAWKDSLPADQLAERFRRSDDPAFAAARKSLGEDADKELKSFKPDDIAYQMGTAWPTTFGVIARNITGSTPVTPTDSVQAGALKSEFDTIYKDLRQYGVDPDQATKQATARLKTTWGASGVNGGQLMRLPPEKLYPAIDGSHGWMTAPLENDIAKFMGKDKLAVDATGLHQNWSYTLQASPQTEVDIASGRPPSYWVFVKDGATGATNIMRNPQNGVRDYYWDASALDASRQRFGEIREGARPVMEGMAHNAEERAQIQAGWEAHFRHGAPAPTQESFNFDRRSGQGPTEPDPGPDLDVPPAPAPTEAPVRGLAPQRPAPRS